MSNTPPSKTIRDGDLAALRRLVESAVHDLQQPVHALRLYAELLRDQPELASELAPRLYRATNAVGASLDALRLSVVNPVAACVGDAQPIDLAQLGLELLDLYAPLASDKVISLRVRLAGLRLRSDPIRLLRVMGNLVGNAVRYTQRGGVVVGARRRSDAMWLEVWDTGVGMTDHEMARAFDDHYRAPNGLGIPGQGLGLGIARRLCEELGATVVLRSQIGRGTMARVVLPEVPASSRHIRS